eukprot:4868296-Pyramimonas_sp.AAC.1
MATESPDSVCRRYAANVCQAPWSGQGGGGVAMTGARGLKRAHAAPPRARGHDANLGRGSLAKPCHITANMRTDVSFHARDL